MRNEPPTGVDLISDADGPTVDHTGHEVVKPLLWLSRISSMPYIPGGAANQVEGLLDRIDRHHVALSEAARKWLETQDPYWLLGCFHRHVRFVGEMLDALRDEPTTVRRLTEVANERSQGGRRSIRPAAVACGSHALGL